MQELKDFNGTLKDITFLNLLIAGRDLEAKEAIDMAIKIQPNDTVNRIRDQN